MTTIPMNKTVAVRKGQGYWDLSRYPWGGSFHRFQADADLPIERVVDWYTNGEPSRLVALLGGIQVGIQL